MLNYTFRRLRKLSAEGLFRASLLHGNSNFIRRNSGKSSCLSITGDYTVTTLSLRANAILRRGYRSFAAKRRGFRASVRSENFSARRLRRGESFSRENISKRVSEEKWENHYRLFYSRVRSTLVNQ